MYYTDKRIIWEKNKMKKFLCLFLSVLLLTGSATVASAAHRGAPSANCVSVENVEKIVHHVARGLLCASEHAVFRMSNDLLYMFDRNYDRQISLQELIAFYREYVMIDISALNGSAEKIAQNADYSMTVLDNGKSTVYVFVSLSEYPELFIPGIFAQAVSLIYDEQEHLGLTADGEHLPLRFSQIAGELVLHEIVYAITSLLGGQFEKSPLNSFYASAVEACINVDENRVPTWFVDVVGVFSTLVSLAGQIFVKQ